MTWVRSTYEENSTLHWWTVCWFPLKALGFQAHAQANLFALNFNHFKRVPISRGNQFVSC